MRDNHEAPLGVQDNDKQLCLGCLAPNSSLANFCGDCGAPLTGYAATGPFERVLAEGHLYREAIQRPRSWIVVAGVWLLFAPMAGAGILAVLTMPQKPDMVWGGFLTAFSVVVLWKTTRRFAANRSAKRSE